MIYVMMLPVASDYIQHPGVGLKLITNWRGTGKMQPWPNIRFYNVINKATGNGN